MSIYPSRAQLLVQIGAGLVMTAISAYVAIDHGNPGKRMIGAVILLFFGAALLLAIYRFISRTVSLSLDADGIRINLPSQPIAFLAWSEIAGVEVIGFMGSLYLGITPKGLDARLKRMSWVSRVLAHVQMIGGRPPLNIPERLVSMPLDELRDLILEQIQSTLPQ